ncbi:MAG: hypothetical protein BGO81_20420 [Devosia sp. 66-22]|nr:MAG: hypothetical protein BGO81_20420 [Devosia sp. 66-22]
MGIADIPVALAYVNAITLWPIVEDAMSQVLARLIGTKNQEAATEIFHTLTAQSTRLPVMKALLQNTAMNANMPEEFDAVIDAFDKLNTERNRYVHDYWFTQEPNGPVYLSPSGRSFVIATLDGARVVTADELNGFRARCTDLLQKTALLPRL